MRKAIGILVTGLMLAGASTVRATQTITATFNNFAPGSSFQPDFTDPLSGIHFRDSTYLSGSGGFSIDSDNEDELFNDGNYLTAGGGINDSIGSAFGFTADLPFAADRVSLDVAYGSNSSSANRISLIGLDATGAIVAQASGVAGLNHFNLEIDSATFNITTFQIKIGGGASAYDNINFTVVPEPTCVLLLGGSAALGLARRRR